MKMGVGPFWPRAIQMSTLHEPMNSKNEFVNPACPFVVNCVVCEHHKLRKRYQIKLRFGKVY